MVTGPDAAPHPIPGPKFPIVKNWRVFFVFLVQIAGMSHTVTENRGEKIHLFPCAQTRSLQRSPVRTWSLGMSRETIVGGLDTYGTGVIGVPHPTLQRSIQLFYLVHLHACGALDLRECRMA